MNWKIYFFETTRGEKPVKEFIKTLSDSTISKVAKSIDLLEKYGTFLCMPHCKKITRDIYELRIRGKEEVRVLYFIQKGNIYLLHVFKKKTQKTPSKEIKIAEYRMGLLTK